jgi:hypothetical protein
MFVPTMRGLQANELGHCNYQHPQRATRHFGPSLDNFSAWVIYASIKGLEIDSRLLHQLGGGDDCLLFRQSDFLDPLNSWTFAAFEQHASIELNVLGRFIRHQLKNDPLLVPALQLPVPDVDERQLQPLSTVPVVPSGPRLIRSNVPDWIAPADATALSSGGPVAPSSYQSWTVPGKPPSPAIRNASPVVPARSAKTAQSNHRAAPEPALPPELLIEPKRKVKFCYGGSGFGRPQLRQQMMLLNPLVWLMCFFGFWSFGPDNVLKTHGQDVPATIMNVERQGNEHCNITYAYQVNDKTYTGETNVSGECQVGQNTLVHVLPSNPAISEDLGDSPGSKQSRDVDIFLLFLFLNLATEVGIWLPLWQHRKLAQSGTAALARVIDCVEYKGRFGQDCFQICLLYDDNWEACKAEVDVSASEFATIKLDAVEPILYDQNSDDVVLYRFCHYHAV